MRRLIASPNRIPESELRFFRIKASIEVGAQAVVPQIEESPRMKKVFAGILACCALYRPYAQETGIFIADGFQHARFFMALQMKEAMNAASRAFDRPVPVSGVLE